MTLAKRLSYAAFVFFLAFQGRLARAETDVLHYRMENGGIFIEFYAGTYESLSEMEETAEGLSNQIEKFKIEHPETEFRFESGYADFETYRGPSQVQDEKPSAKKFTTRLLERLSRKNIKPDLAQGLNLDKTPAETQTFYQKYARWVWTLVRVGTVGGIVYVNEMSTPGHLEAAPYLVLPSLAAILGTAVFNNEINNFQGEFKLKAVIKGTKAMGELQRKISQKLFDQFDEGFKKIFGAKAKEKLLKSLSSVGSDAWVNDWHSKINFYAIEVAFGEVLNLPKTGIDVGGMKVDGILERFDIPGGAATQSELWGSAVISTWAQQPVEAALYNLYAAKVKEGKLTAAQLKVVRTFGSALGSVLSVTGFILANSGSGVNLGKIVGYSLLGVLRVGGVYLNKYVDHKYAKFLYTDLIDQVNLIECDKNMGGNLLKNSSKLRDEGLTNQAHQDF